MKLSFVVENNTSENMSCQQYFHFIFRNQFLYFSTVGCYPSQKSSSNVLPNVFAIMMIAGETDWIPLFQSDWSSAG